MEKYRPTLEEFIEKYCSIKMPDGSIRPLKLRDQDREYMKYMQECVQKGKKIALWKGRIRFY